MSGLDGLGWPNPEDERNDSSERDAPPRRSAASCSPSSDAPETLEAWKKFEKNKKIVAFLKHAIRIERERDEWQLHALMKMAVKQLACMWCGEIVHAPTGYEPGTPLSEEQRGQAYREHVAICPKHPVAPLREALKFIATDKIANAADMRYRAARALESLPENTPALPPTVGSGDSSTNQKP